MKPRFFISHASNREPGNDRVIQVREKLRDRLKDDWEVFLDLHSIDAGQRWRGEVLARLASAQAAVILFDTYAARKSKWVPAEAMVLCFKKSLDPSFQLVPVLFDGLTLKSTAFGKYEPFDLHEIIALPDDVTASPTDLVEKIASGFDPTRVTSGAARRGWVEEVVARLKEDRTFLELAAQQLAIDVDDLLAAPGAWSDTSLLIRRAVVQLLHHHQRLVDCVGAIGDLMNPMNNEERTTFANYLYAKWVPNQAVETLLDAGRNAAKRGLVGLNTTDMEVLRHYSARAAIETRPTTVHFVSVSDATGDDDDSMYQATVNSLRSNFFKSATLLNDGRDPKQAINERLQSGNRLVLCCLPERFAKKSLVDRLRTDFPRVVFFLTTEMTGTTALTAAGAALLKPTLDLTLLDELDQLKFDLAPLMTA